MRLKDLFAYRIPSVLTSSPSPSVATSWSTTPRTLITEETLKLLVNLAGETDLRSAIDAMFNGDKINMMMTEGARRTAHRPAQPLDRPIEVDGKDVMPEVNVLAKMKGFCEKVIGGEWKGYTGKAISTWSTSALVVPIWAPVMITGPLRPYKNHLEMHFVSNVDGTHIAETPRKIDPETTLFLVASKDLHHPGDHDQRPDRPRLVPRSCAGDKATLPGTSPPCLPAARLLPSSASTPTTCSSSGTGSAAATPPGPPSACHRPLARALWEFLRGASGDGHALRHCRRTERAGCWP